MKFFTTIFLIFCFLIPTYVFGQEKPKPTAKIVSSDVAFCESGSAIVKIEFTGAPPFKFNYTEGTTTYSNVESPGFTFEKTVSPDNTTTITLTKVYDSNYTIFEGGSTEVTGSMEVRIDQMPTLDAGSDTEVCGYEYDMLGKVTGATTKVWWTDPGGSGSFNDTTILNAKFIGTLASEYELTLNAENGSCYATDEVDITLKGRPKGEITNLAPWPFCSTDETADALPIELKFIGKGGFTYALQDEDGNALGSFTSAGANHTNLVPVSTNKTISLSSLKDGQGCSAKATDLQGSRTATDVKPKVFAGDDVAVNCGPEYTLEASSSPATTGKWTSATAGIVFADNTGRNSLCTASFGANETFKNATLRWTETTTDALACASYDELNIKFIQPPALTLKPLSNNQICKDKSITLDFEVSGNAPWTIDYNLGGASLIKSLSLTDKQLNILGPDFMIGNNSVNISKIKDSFNCESVLTIAQDILVDEKPMANAGFEQDVCGRTVHLDAEPSVGQGEWMLSTGLFEEKNVPNTTFIANNTGVLNLVWKETNGVCVDTDTVKVTFFDAPYPVKEVADTFVVYAAKMFELTALPLTVGTGQWSIQEPTVTGASITDASLYNASLSNLSTKQVYKLEWKAILESAPENCREKIYNVVIDSNPILAPTGISPDGDGINDVLEILGVKENSSLTVFNKHGKLVFKMDNYDNSWGGTDQSGTKLAPDTYLYVYQDEGITIKNYLIIKY